MGDVDSYMRLYQVSELHETGHWYDSIYHRSNAPYGELRQWTRPLDAVLYAGARLFSLKTDFNSALFFWGWIIGPLIHILALLAIFWATRPFLSSKAHTYVGLLFICQMGILSYFTLGNADHHHLLLLLFILSTGFTLRLLIFACHPGVCLAAGALSALYVWVSTEAMLPLFVNLLALGLCWTIERRDYAQKSFLFSLALFGATALALALERPWSDWLLLEVDRISFIHLGIFGIISLLWGGIWALDGAGCCRRFPGRLIIAPAGLLLAGLAVWLCFPKFFQGPFVDIAPEVRNLLLKNSLHMQPMTSLPDFWPTFILFLGFALPVLPFTLYRLSLSLKRRQDYEGWLYLTVALVIFLPVTLYQMRWTAYTGVLVVIPLAELLAAVLKKQEYYLTDFWRPGARALTIVFFCTITLFLAPLAGFSSAEGPVPIKYFSMAKICDYLNESRDKENRPQRVLAFFFLGPEILWRTSLEVIGTPDHRNARGILDSQRILSAACDEEAFRLIRERRIDLILLCPPTGESRLLSSAGQTSTFYQRLQQGELPAWLQQISLPGDLPVSFLLFKVMVE